MRKAPLVLALAALAPGAPAQGQVDLVSVYSVVRPALCALMANPLNCPLPKDIILGVPYSNVRAKLAESPDVFAVGDARTLPSAFFSDMAARASRGSFTVYWASLAEDVEYVKSWAKKVSPRKGAFTTYTFAVPEVEITRAATRIPFIAIEDRVYFYLAVGWFELSGGFARQILTVVRNGASYLAAAAKREEEAQRNLERARQGVGSQ